MIEREEEKKKDERNRLNSTYDTETYEMILDLASALGVSPTKIQTELVKMCLQNESAINAIQEKFKRRSRFRVIPSRLENGQMKLIFAEKKGKRK